MTTPTDADRLVEQVAMTICRGGGTGLCVGFCHSKRCPDAIAQYQAVARAIIPLVQQAERADVVKWLRETDWGDDDDDLYGALAEAVERGEHLKGTDDA